MRLSSTRLIGAAIAVGIVVSNLVAIEKPPIAEAATTTIDIPLVATRPAVDGGDLVAALPAQSTATYSMAGVTWQQATVGAKPVVSIRVKDASRWQEWQQLELGDFGITGKGFTDVIFLGSNLTGVEVRIVARTGQNVREPKLILMNSDRLSAPRSQAPMVSTRPLSGPYLAPAAEGQLSEPTAANGESDTYGIGGPGQPAGIIPRSAWGANEASVPADCGELYDRMEGAVVHHTAGSNDYSAQQSAGIVNGIFRYHTITLGWCDIGYNFLVDRYGQIFEGRRNSISGLPHGAHAYWANGYSVGISIMGNSDSWAPSAGVYDRVSQVLAWKFGQYGKDPTQPATYWNYMDNRWETVGGIVGHREVGQTGCPGANIWANMGTIKSGTYNRMQTYILHYYKLPETTKAGTFTVVGYTSANMQGKPVYVDMEQVGTYSARVPATGWDHQAVFTNFGLAPGNYRFRIIAAPGGAKPIVSPWQSVQVTAEPVEFTSPAHLTTFASNNPITITGKVYPAKAGVNVTLMTHPTNSNLPRVFGTAITNADGSFSASVQDPALLRDKVGWLARVGDYLTPELVLTFPGNAPMPRISPALPASTSATTTSQITPTASPSATP